ncbi:MAG TPA: T9SS type A sorting domain-containing protein [Ignavibacteriaceae bacterium]|nr:T9SS type A sorting domain-containing protein [Ignavibacteriaceae bacterium]
MKTIAKFITLFVLLFSFQFYGQYSIDIDIIEPSMPELAVSEQPGGRMITSIAENGQYLRILIVFVQFKDDNWNTTWGEWPIPQPPNPPVPPSGWMNTNIIDQLVSQNSTNQNLTHYFTVMSKEHYKVIGNTYHKVTTNTRSEYITMNYDRGDINRQILQELDGSIDYSIYDKWNKIGEYNHSWGSDGEVDMIWMVYRNIDNDLPIPGYTAWKLGFGSRSIIGQDTTYSRWSGEASLGWAGILPVDKGARTIDLGPFGLVSGLTMMMGYNGLGYVKNVLVHEFGHHLFGGNEAHLGTAGLWAIMASYGSRSQMANSWERHRLGWLNPMQYNYNPLIPVPLQDHLTTGQVLRILIPNSNPARYYYLENHQRLSPFDNIDLTADGKGIYVIYQGGSSGSSLRFWNAEGRSLWTRDHCAIHPNGANVAVFKEGLQSPSGKFDTEAIPHTACYSGGSTLSPIEAFVSPITGQDVFQPLFAGDNRDMMKPNYVDVFNPVSNPAVEGISFQVISESSQLKIVQKVESGTVYDTPPSKPQNLAVATSVNYHPYLTWNANQEPDVLSGGSYKVEKYSTYEVGWFQLATTTNTFYEDLTETICPPGQQCESGHWVRYRVKAVDNTAKVSVPSDSVMKMVLGGAPDKISVDPPSSEMPTEYSLMQNYPNPFNPVTTISYLLPKNGLVTLKVFDILGTEVTSLVNETQEAGSYSVTFNASQLPSGIYFYTLTSNNFMTTKKLILLK